MAALVAPMIDELTFLIQVRNAVVNRGELLKVLHLAEAKNRLRPSPEDQVAVLDVIVGPVVEIVSVDDAEVGECGTVRAQFIAGSADKPELNPGGQIEYDEPIP